MVGVAQVLSLCSGYGGLDLGVGLVVSGSRTVCYVEREAQAAALLAARMADGTLDEAPVWSDLSTFDATAWYGEVDVVTAGFPCQPVSVAGKRLGSADSRWLWPQVLRALVDTGAEVGLFENVPGLVTRGLEGILKDLASVGFDAEWGVYGAWEVGATHKRDRLFILAYAGRECLDRLQPVSELGGSSAAVLGGARQTLGVPRFPPGPEDTVGWLEWPGPQPYVCRGADGAADRLDRLRMLGNGVVPQQAAYALCDLIAKARE